MTPPPPADAGRPAALTMAQPPTRGYRYEYSSSRGTWTHAHVHTRRRCTTTKCERVHVRQVRVSVSRGHRDDASSGRSTVGTASYDCKPPSRPNTTTAKSQPHRIGSSNVSTSTMSSEGAARGDFGGVGDRQPPRHSTQHRVTPTRIYYCQPLHLVCSSKWHPAGIYVAPKWA